MAKPADRGKPPAPDAGTPKNDRSMWPGRVVAADEFAPAPRGAGLRRWLLVAALLAVVGGGAAAVFLALR